MMVLVDTPIWSLALRRTPLKLSAAERSLVAKWRRLVERGDVALLGMVRQEILSGVRDAETFAKLRDHLSAFHDVGLVQQDHERAAQHFNQCRKNGVAASHTDMLITSIAVGHRVPIFTVDGDFAHYAKVLPIKLYRVE
jgi:predicted nucleic acid-binding protein